MLVHPLKEVIESGMTQKAAAVKLGVTPQHLSDLIHQHRGVGARLALQVQDAFGVDAMTVLIRQAAHDLTRALKQRKEAGQI